MAIPGTPCAGAEKCSDAKALGVLDRHLQTLDISKPQLRSIRSDQIRDPVRLLTVGVSNCEHPKLEFETSRFTSSSSLGRGTWEGDTGLNQAGTSWDRQLGLGDRLASANKREGARFTSTLLARQRSIKHPARLWLNLFRPRERSPSGMSPHRISSR